MLDHIGLDVSDYPRSRTFYQKALEPLGYKIIMEVTAEQTGSYQGGGFGEGHKPSFWIGASGKSKAAAPVHVAFVAGSRAAVDAFYQAAIAAGGSDNGPPGVRAHYHPNYYGAFVLDPDGHNIEAVCHAPA